MFVSRLSLCVALTILAFGMSADDSLAQRQESNYHIAYAFPPGWQEKEPGQAFDLIEENQTESSSSVRPNLQPQPAIPSQGSSSRSRVPIRPAPVAPAFQQNATPGYAPAVPQILGQPTAPVYTPSVGVAAGVSGFHSPQVQPARACTSCFQERTLGLFGGYNWLIRSGDVIFPFAGDMDEDFVVGVSLGKRLSRNVRTELEYAYRQNNGRYDRNAPVASNFGFLESTVQSGMANIYCELDNIGKLKPYVGVGIGLAHVDGDIFDTGNSLLGSVDQGTNFAFQAIGGLEIQLRRAKLFTEYRYFGTGDVETTLNTEADYRSNNWILGLRWSF